MNLLLHLLKYFYRKISRTNLENNPRWFPLSKNGSEIDTFNKPFLSKDGVEGYFTRFYKSNLHISKFLNIKLNLGKYFLFKYEIIKAKIIDDIYEIEGKKDDYLIPISTFDKNIQKFSITDDKQDKKEIGIFPERYTYLNFKKNSKIKIKSDKKFIIGEPILKRLQKKNKYNLVILVFLDGFSNQEIPGFDVKKHYLNINDFFKEGILFKNNFCNAEWTLPSVPSFFTGMRQQNHGFYHNKKFHTFREDTKLLQELFKEKGYVTLNVNSNPRVSPLSGYTRGFDRTIHKLNFNFEEICNEIDEHVNAFKDRDKFIFVSLFDLHETPGGLLSLEAQSGLGNDYLKKNLIKNKSLSAVKNKKFFYDEIEIEKYLSQLKKIDRTMVRIFDILNRYSKVENSLISLVTDHGHPYTENTSELLSRKRMNVPWYIKGGGITPSVESDFTENVDCFSSLVNLCELEKDGNRDSNFKEDFLGENNTDGILPKCFGGSSKRDFAFVQSIYDNQPFTCKIIDNDTEFLLKSRENLTRDGKINLNNPSVSCSNNNDVKKISFYQDYCLKRAEEWNSSIDKNKFKFL